MYKKPINSQVKQSKEEIYTMLRPFMEEIKEGFKNAAKICFINTLDDKKYGLYLLLSSLFAQTFNFGMKFVELPKDLKKTCSTAIKVLMAFSGTFAASYVAIFGYAKIENSGAKLAENIEVLIDIATDVYEGFSEKNDEICKIPTFTKHAYNIGFLYALFSKEFADTELINVGGISVTLKEIFPMLGLIQSLSMLSYKSYRKCNSNDPSTNNNKKPKKIMIKHPNSLFAGNKHYYGTFETKESDNEKINNNDVNQTGINIMLFNYNTQITSSLNQCRLNNSHNGFSPC